jgi:tRNA(Ile2)-agmatinylcytidine synthase
VTVLGLDDTDSRDRGMCTTYAAARVARRLRERGAAVDRTLLVRLNPAVEFKTRGNAALAVHTDADPAEALAVARAELDRAAAVGDPQTNPGVVVAPGPPGDVPDGVAAFARGALREHHAIADAEARVEAAGYEAVGWGNGRGRVGALAAVGAWRAFGEWTYERIAYRPESRWGTEREVDRDSVFAAADRGYPTVWDTVDRGEGEAVCVPHTPGPVLYGVRGDDPDSAERVATGIDSEPPVFGWTFVTNQGTDAHLRAGALADLQDGRAYRVEGTVSTAPETRRGGHVFFELRADRDREGDEDGRGAMAVCAAFEPTKRFRDRVRALRSGDRIAACGEVSVGTLKLEKFAVRDLVRTERIVPECSSCGASMESAGADQGYRCRDCGTDAPGKVATPIERALEPGWYEVPPCARRHVAKPLVRGGFDAPVHPER